MASANHTRIKLNERVTLSSILLGARVKPGADFADCHTADEYTGSEFGIVIAVVNGKTAASAGKRYAKVRWVPIVATAGTSAAAAPAVNNISNATPKEGLYRIADGDAYCDLLYAEAIVAPGLEGSPVDAATAIVGARVSRAPDAEWPWGNEQQEQLTAPGGAVVVGCSAESGWVRVKMANGKVQVYRGGVEESKTLKFDLVYGAVGEAPNVSIATANQQKEQLSKGANAVATAAAARMGSEEQNQVGAAAAESAGKERVAPVVLPSIKGGDLVTVANFRVSARVVANRGGGGDWRWGEQDRENGGWGVLLTRDKESWVRVRWASGLKRSYRAGADMAYDLRYDDNPLYPKIPEFSDAAAFSAPAAAASSAATTPAAPSGAATPAAASASPIQRAKYKFCAEFKALQPIVIESVLYQIQDEERARRILFDMDAVAAAEQSRVPNIDDILLAPEPPREGGGNGAEGLNKEDSLEVIIKVQKKKKAETDEDVCLICLDQMKVYAAIPCGHLQICSNCIEEFKKNSGGTCLVCRTPYTTMLRIYM